MAPAMLYWRVRTLQMGWVAGRLVRGVLSVIIVRRVQRARALPCAGGRVGGGTGWRLRPGSLDHALSGDGAPLAPSLRLALSQTNDERCFSWQIGVAS